MKVKPKFKCGIDTVEVKSSTLLTIDKSDRLHRCITRVRVINAKGDTKYYGYRIDPSLLSGFIIDNLQYCIELILSLLRYLNLEAPVITRIDYCFDDYEHTYDELFKINLLLFILLKDEYIFHNNFVSDDLDSPKGKSTKNRQKWIIKKRMLEAEFYDKTLESNNSKILCRLEFRSKPLDIQIDFNSDIVDIAMYCETEFKLEFNRWLEMVNKVAQFKYNELNKHLYGTNDKLISEDEKDVEKGVHKKTDFGSTIQINHKRIFTRRQLGDLLRKIGIGSYESRATKYIDEHPGIELYKPSDLQEYVEEITIKADAYMNTYFFSKE